VADLPVTSKAIAARLLELSEIEEERQALLALQRIYDKREALLATGATPAPLTLTGGATEATAQPAARRGPPRPANANGTTDVIVRIVKAKPGIKSADLIDEVLTQIESKAVHPRHNVSTIARYLVDRDRIRKTTDGRYFPG